MLSKMLIVPSVSISDGVTETSAFDKLCRSSLLPLFFAFLFLSFTIATSAVTAEVGFADNFKVRSSCRKYAICSYFEVPLTDSGWLLVLLTRISF